MLAIVHGQPKVMSLKEVLEYFLDFRRDVTTRRTIYELEQAEARAHILRGLKIALDQLDEVIALIRASDSPSEARMGLMSEFGLSREQSQAILDLRLQKLTGLEREKIIEELEEVEARISYLQGILADESKLMEVIEEEMLEVVDEYRNERRTEIQYEVSEISLEDLIAEEDMVVTLTHQGYIKRTPITTYRSQRRGGRGRRGMDTKDEDFVKDMFVASTHTNILIFTSSGDVYMLRTHQLPEGSPTAKGQAVVNLISIDNDERVEAILPIEEFEEDRYLVMATRNGIIKRTELTAYENVHSGGIIALTLKEGDELIDVELTGGEDHLFLTSRQGQSIRFHEADARAIGRTAMGVIGIRLEGDDEVVEMEVIPEWDVNHPDESELTVLTITENGYGKRTPIAEYRDQSRGGKGLITMKVNDRNGPVVGARLVDETDELMLITDDGQLIRCPVEDISTYGRNTQGVKVMVTSEDEKVVSMARIDEEEQEAEEEEGAEGQEAAGEEESADEETGSEGDEPVEGEATDQEDDSAVEDASDEPEEGADGDGSEAEESEE
jgi:DNA gyrase subunit A